MKAGEADLAVAEGLGEGDVLLARKASLGVEAPDGGLKAPCNCRLWWAA
jgi:hypothetical protein